jgi:hypothetical protein
MRLFAILNEPLFAPLTKVILGQAKSGIDSTLANAITQATVRLASSIHSSEHSTQLLGAVTSIEILLGEPKDKYDTVQHRLEMLFGKPTFDELKVDKLLKARHLYVHDGKDIEDKKLAGQTIALALSCLLCYAEAIQQFESKHTFGQYLNFIYEAEKVAKANKWDEVTKAEFRKLIYKHRQGRHVFDFEKTYSGN